MTHHITVSTTKDREVVDITDRVAKLDVPAECESALVFVKHTTAALSTADLDPGTDLDMLDAFKHMIPDLDYRHPHDPSHVPDHILATLIGPSVTVPLQDSGPELGTWQRIVLFEFDGPRERTITVVFR